MKYCKDCGNKITRLKAASFYQKYRCNKCGLRIGINVGLRNHGVDDSYYFYHSPFENEVVYKKGDK